MSPSDFDALVVEKDGESVGLAMRRWTVDQLMPGEVTIRVAYSSVNYKDGLAVRADGKVARRYPLVPGIDIAGTVIDSSDRTIEVGQFVLAHGYDIGIAHHGGFAEVARVPALWVVPLPKGLSLRQAMAIGTAGFTAALSVARLESFGVRRDSGPVIVTGASGGVGSIAVALLAGRGFEVVASTGSEDARDYLQLLGAASIISRQETSGESTRPLEHTRWAAAVDTVGGQTFGYLLRTLNYGGSVAICGNVGGAQVSTSVFPFILRGVNVFGIDSVQVPLEQRISIWKRLAEDLRPPHLDELTQEVTLEQVPAALAAITRNSLRGRTVVRVTPS